MKCPNCKNYIPNGSKFCNHCGERMVEDNGVIYCSNPKCGKEIPSDSKFCPFCGNSLSIEEQNQESEITIFTDSDNCSIHSREGYDNVLLKSGKNILSVHTYPWIDNGFFPKDSSEDFVSFDLSAFDTSHINNMGGMFCGCSSLRTLDLSNFNTSNVEDMRCMFDGCSSLRTLNLINFNTSNVKDMRGMFAGCSSLRTLDLSNFETSQLQYMARMFMECTGLKILDLSNFNTSCVWKVDGLFAGCTGLEVLDLSNFNLSEAYVYVGSAMFLNCYALKKVYLRNCNERTILIVKDALEEYDLSPEIVIG